MMLHLPGIMIYRCVWLVSILVTRSFALTFLIPDGSQQDLAVTKHCNITLGSTSVDRLENYIYSDTVALMYMNITYRGNIIDDYKAPTKWIWANQNGLNILKMDYRYMVFSLTTMKPSIYYPLRVEIVDNPAGCHRNLSRLDLAEKVAFAVAQAGRDFIDSDDDSDNDNIDQYVCFQNFSQQLNKTCKTKCKIVEKQKTKVQISFDRQKHCSLDISSTKQDNRTEWCNLDSRRDGLYYMIHILSAIFVLYAVLLTGYIEDTGQILTCEEIMSREIPSFYQMNENDFFYLPNCGLIYGEPQRRHIDGNTSLKKVPNSETDMDLEVSSRQHPNHQLCQPECNSLIHQVDSGPNTSTEWILVPVDVHDPEEGFGNVSSSASAAGRQFAVAQTEGKFTATKGEGQFVRAQTEGQFTVAHIEGQFAAPQGDVPATIRPSITDSEVDPNPNGPTSHTAKNDWCRSQQNHCMRQNTNVSIESDSSDQHSECEVDLLLGVNSQANIKYGTSDTFQETSRNVVARIASYPDEYITVSHIPAVRLTDLFHSICLSPASPWVIRMRRLFFIILLPFHLYSMACIDLLLYREETFYRARNRDPFVNTVDYFLLLNWGQLDAYTKATVYLYLFSLLTYGLAGLLFTFRAPLNLDQFSDDGKFLGRCLPRSLLKYPSKPPSHGWKNLFETLHQRACLMIDRKFWTFYKSDLAFNLQTILASLFPEMESQGLLVCFTVCLYPFWLVWMCVAWLLLTPLGALLNHMANVLLHGFSLPEEPESSGSERERLLHSGEGKPRLHFFTFVYLIVMFLWLFVALIAFLVVPTTHMLSSFLRNTIQGLLLNHKKYLPHVILTMAAIFYVLKFYHELPDLYRRLTLTLFEEAEEYQSQNDTKDSKNHDLLLTDMFGHKWLPRDLYDHVYTRLLPVRQAAFRAGIKIILTLVFIYFLFDSMSEFDLFNDSGLGQSLVTLLIVQAPRLTGFFPKYTCNCVDLYQQRGEIKSIIQSYVQQTQWRYTQTIFKY